MFSKIVIFSTLLAVAFAAPGGLVVAGHTPAATTLVAGAPIAYAAAPAPIVKTVAAAPLPLAAPGPVAVAGPAVHYAAAPAPIAVPAPVAYTTGVRVAHIHTPVEQHGYQIAY